MHKLWQAGEPRSYHAEYGFSCMGHEELMRVMTGVGYIVETQGFPRQGE